MLVSIDSGIFYTTLRTFDVPIWQTMPHWGCSSEFQRGEYIFETRCYRLFACICTSYPSSVASPRRNRGFGPPLLFRPLLILAEIRWIFFIGGCPMPVYCNFYCSPAKKKISDPHVFGLTTVLLLPVEIGNIFLTEARHLSLPLTTWHCDVMTERHDVTKLPLPISFHRYDKKMIITCLGSIWLFQLLSLKLLLLFCMTLSRHDVTSKNSQYLYRYSACSYRWATKMILSCFSW